MQNIKQTKSKGGELRYAVSSLSRTGRPSFRTFPTRGEAEAFAELPDSARPAFERSFAAAHAASQIGWIAQREERLALMKLALETCARLAELRSAKWGDIDLDARIWRIPNPRSSSIRRVVPLTREAVSILRGLETKGGPAGELVFAHAGSHGKVSSDIPSLMEELGLPHHCFFELRHAAIERMRERQKLLNTKEVSKIVDFQLRAPRKASKRGGKEPLLPTQHEEAIWRKVGGLTMGASHLPTTPGDGSVAIPTGPEGASSTPAPRLSVFERRARAWTRLYELAIETCANFRELASARWTEFDLTSRVWNIPKEHARGERDRRILLSNRAIEILHETLAVSRGGLDRVFGMLPEEGRSPERFADAMQTLGLPCKNYFELRRLARQRFAASYPMLSSNERARILGYKHPI